MQCTPMCPAFSTYSVLLPDDFTCQRIKVLNVNGLRMRFMRLQFNILVVGYTERSGAQLLGGWAATPPPSLK